MAKKDLTTIICVVLLLLVAYLYYKVSDLGSKIEASVPIGADDPLTNPYVPPIRHGSSGPPVPTNIPTQWFDLKYTQIGILTKAQTILPLMGRRLNAQKWQYYAVSGGGGGNLQIKLPIQVKGRNASGEYGCDEIFSKDSVFVEGYDSMYVTIYENGLFSYLPF